LRPRWAGIYSHPRREADMRTLCTTAMCALVVLATSTTHAADASVPSCDLFKQRFAEAPLVLELQLPKLKLNREPPDPLLHDDTWKTEGMRAKDSGEMWYGTTVHCRAGKFYDFFANIDAPDVYLHPTFDLIAASVYAYTGWPANKVVSVTDGILKKQPRVMADIATTELLRGVYAAISYMQFAIELDE
jgi:hypothetical protein